MCCYMEFDAPGLISFSANVNVTIATADEQIPVSDRVKRQLERRRREGESFNDVLKCVLDESEEAGFYDGFGILSDEEPGFETSTRTPKRSGKSGCSG